MSSPSKRRKLDAEFSGKEDQEITLTFDDNTTLKTFRSVLEEASPVLKTALNDCGHDGTLRLPRTTNKAWELILYYIASKDPPSDVSSRIKSLSCNTLVDVVKQCRMHEIASLTKAVDGTIAEYLAALNSRDSAVYVNHPFEFQYLRLNDCRFEVVRRTEMVKSERELASFLVQIIIVNEEIIKVRVENGMKPHIRGFDSAVGRIFRFINEMHNDGRDSFCFLFAKELLLKKSSAFSDELSDILVKALDP